MASTTHPDAFHFERPVPSYWEASAAPLDVATPPLEEEAICDVAVIGAGYTGLSAALELALQHLDVRVLEAGHVGWGASGRNGGFACVGSHKLGYDAMIRTYGLAATRDYYRAMVEAVDLVRDLLSRYGIDAGVSGEGEVTLAHRRDRLADLGAEQAFLRTTFGVATELLAPGDLRQRGLWGPEFHGGLLSPVGFGLHPLNYVRGLARAATNAGVRIHGASRVRSWQATAEGHRLITAGGSLRARRVILATNGYTSEDLWPPMAGRLMPALSSILVTRPLSLAERQAQGWTSALLAYDSRNLLHYFRLLPDDRFLFGGRGGTDASEAGGRSFAPILEGAFRRLFPAWKEVPVSHYWRGFVCLAYDLVPYLGPLDENRTVWTAGAYHGNGVAMATWSGRALARLMAGQLEPAALPAVLTRRLARFPLPAFRPLYLKGAYLWYGWKDSR